MTGLHKLGLMGASEAAALRSALRASEGWSQATRATEPCLHFSYSSKYFAFTLWLPDFPDVSTALPWSTECSPPNTFLLRAGERLVSPQPWGLVWHPGLQGLGLSLLYPEGVTGSNWRCGKTFGISGKDHVTKPMLVN